MPRKPDPQTPSIQFNIGTLKMGLADITKFKAALKYYGWESIASFLRQAALALIRHHAAGEPIQQPLQFQTFIDASMHPGVAQRKKYGQALRTFAHDDAAAEHLGAPQAPQADQ